MYHLAFPVYHWGKLGTYNIHIYVNKKTQKVGNEMKNMHWTNTSMHLHDESWNRHWYILNGSWCTSTTTPLPSQPSPHPLKKWPPEHSTTLIVNIDTFSHKLHKSPAVICMERRNSYRCCYMNSGVSSMNICPTSRPMLCETVVCCCVI